MKWEDVLARKKPTETVSQNLLSSSLKERIAKKKELLSMPKIGKEKITMLAIKAVDDFRFYTFDQKLGD